MKEKILDYLKDHYNINVSQLLISGVKNGSVGMIDALDALGDSLPLVYTTQKDEEETDFYLFCIGEDRCRDKMDTFISGLKSFIQENSNRKIAKSSYDKEWYYWQDKDVKLSFGIKSERSGFSMRLSIPNNELTLSQPSTKKITEGL